MFLHSWFESNYVLFFSFPLLFFPVAHGIQVSKGDHRREGHGVAWHGIANGSGCFLLSACKEKGNMGFNEALANGVSLSFFLSFFFYSLFFCFRLSSLPFLSLLSPPFCTIVHFEIELIHTGERSHFVSSLLSFHPRYKRDQWRLQSKFENHTLFPCRAPRAWFCGFRFRLAVDAGCGISAVPCMWECSLPNHWTLEAARGSGGGGRWPFCWMLAACVGSVVVVDFCFFSGFGFVFIFTLLAGVVGGA